MSDPSNIRRRKRDNQIELVLQIVRENLEAVRAERLVGTLRMDFMINLGGVYDIKDARLRDGVLRARIAEMKSNDGNTEPGE